MNLSDALLHPSEYDGAEISAYWQPVIGDNSSVLHVSVFGNLFLLNEQGHVLLLDSWSGDIHGVSESYEQYKTDVGTDPEFFRSWFLTDLIELLDAGGMTRGAGQVFAPFVSPALGGRLVLENFSTAPIKTYAALSSGEVLARRKV
ncbi:hypothetical protein HNP48_005211 [Acidovorax soli]|uniref:T6SS immunity protein Tdi1 C-terminal domain-containing protein n=1 Tax=Acidovorax soli TaxID=592050 RepID=A0A7X0UBV6_9BURK|nr:T6SS immunity protein Tdi1 domain-containing protein [Acidovorax soli]MBB6562498.1 hypothetical protein [Acidovorax soli]